jgi:hypothetical protein
MSVIGELRTSLDAIGFEQQAFLFAFLASYPLVLGGLLEARGRRIAGMTATASMIGFVAMTDPWIHGVMLVVIIVASSGLFIATVCALDQLPRLMARQRLEPIPIQAELPLQSAEAPREREGSLRPKLPLTGHAGTT